jgi:acetyl esterase/lipase
MRQLLIAFPLLAIVPSAHAQTFGPYPEETYVECTPAKPTRQAIVLTHGNWATGSNKQTNILQLCTAFAAKGFDAVSIGYRMVYSAHWPAMLQDTQTAIRWMRSRGFTKVGAGGTSAGGTLSLLAGAIDQVRVSQATDPKGEAALYPGYSSKADFVVDISGPTDIAEENAIKGSDTILTGIPLPKDIAAATISPLTYVNGAMSPTIVFEGMTDANVPRDMIDDLVTAFKSEGVTYQVQYYRAGHVFTGLPAANELTCVDEAIEFARLLKPLRNNWTCLGPVAK